MNATGVALALFIGMLLPLQALINASLGKQTFGPVFASLASFMVGTGVLLAWWWLSRPVFVPAALGKVPWWAWTGGMIGAVFVASATLLVPRLGAASLICLVVAGQLAGSVVLDHFLASYSAINSFIQLVTKSRRTDDKLRRWPPRSGTRELV